jgi:hypothetical protein
MLSKLWEIFIFVSASVEGQASAHFLFKLNQIWLEKLDSDFIGEEYFKFLREKNYFPNILKIDFNFACKNVTV